MVSRYHDAREYSMKREVSFIMRVRKVHDILLSQYQKSLIKNSVV
nr:hypothetical protein B11C_110316 [Bartonella sp. 1-1C]